METKVVNTSAPKGAWKLNFPPYKGIMTDKLPTDGQTRARREVSLPIINLLPISTKQGTTTKALTKQIYIRIDVPNKSELWSGWLNITHGVRKLGTYFCF